MKGIAKTLKDLIGSRSVGLVKPGRSPYSGRPIVVPDGVDPETCATKERLLGFYGQSSGTAQFRDAELVAFLWNNAERFLEALSGLKNRKGSVLVRLTLLEARELVHAAENVLDDPDEWTNYLGSRVKCNAALRGKEKVVRAVLDAGGYG